MTWAVAFGLLKRFYGPVAVIVAAGLAWLLFRTAMTNIELGRGLSKAKAELVQTKASLAAAEVAFADLIRDYNAAAREADAREAALEKDREDALQKQRSDYATRTAQLDRSLQLALDSLRHAAGADRRFALKPAADSPAACRDHACSPANLDVRNSEFLIRLADRADRVAVQLGACQRYVSEVVLRSPEQQ